MFRLNVPRVVHATPNGRVAAAWVVGAVVLILLAILPPQPAGPQRNELTFQAFRPHVVRGRDVAQNLALYAPLGLLLALRGTSLGTAVGAAAALSFGTELLQYAVPGRDPNALDVVVNTLGALIGAVAVRSRRIRARIVTALGSAERWLTHARRPDAHRASRLLLGWVAAVAAVAAMTAALLAPAPLPLGGLAIASPSLDRSLGPLRIGSSGAQTGFFRGAIDEVRISNTVRTSEEIAADMVTQHRPAGSGDSGFVAAYRFDASSGSVARDDTGRGHDGSISGATWTPQGRHGGALIFNGRSSEIIVPSAAALDLREAMTLEAWVLASGESAAEATVIGKADDVYYLRASSNFGPLRAAGGGRFGATPRFAHVAEPFRSGEWTHLATTYDGESIRVYINGVLASTRVHWSAHRLVRASLNGVELTPGTLEDPAAFRAALTRHITLEAVLTCGPARDTRAPVFLISGLQSSEPLALIASGDDLFVKPLARARRFGMASPATRVSGAFRECHRGSRLAVTVSGQLQNPRVAVGGSTVRATAPGIGSTWALLVQSDLLPGWVELLGTTIWLVLLAIPIGLWARWTILGAISMGLLAAALLYIPNLFYVRRLFGHEVAALMMGGIIGIAARMTAGNVNSAPGDAAPSRSA